MKQSFFDTFDENNNPLGKVASYDDVHDKGLWHRGVHVIIYTPEKEIVMQKRSPSLKYHPNEIEVSVGGGVDAGESPEQAAIREIKEELGLRITKDQLRFIGHSKFNHKTKTQINRTFNYAYSLCLPKDQLEMKIDEEETSVVFMITEKKLRKALRVHRIKNIGKISSRYSYWKYLLDSI